MHARGKKRFRMASDNFASGTEFFHGYAKGGTTLSRLLLFYFEYG
jgi:hypothetical protein